MLTNEWMVAIAIGIASAIIFIGCAKAIETWVFRKQYRYKVKKSNDIIVRRLQPYIAERGIPNYEVINAIVNSVARENGVDASQLYSVEVLCEELIGEIINNVYVSSGKKEEYLKNLSDYIKKLDGKEKKKIEYKVQEEKNTKKFSLEVVLFPMAVAMIYFTYVNSIYMQGKNYSGMLTICGVFVSSVFLINVVLLLKGKCKRNKKEEKEKVEEIKKEDSK